MVFHSDPAVVPSSVQPGRSFLRSSQLRDFRKGLLIVFGLEAGIPVVSYLAVTFLHFPPYVIDISAVALFSLSISFSLVKRTGKIRSGLQACLLANLGYIVGLLAVDIVILASTFVANFDPNNDFDSFMGITFYMVYMGIVAILTVLGLGVVSLTSGSLGAFLGKWGARSSLLAAVKDE